MANEDNEYLTYFGLNHESNINDKLVVFSSAVIKTYLEIRNGLLNNPNYNYADDKRVLFLTQLRNDILENNPDLLNDYISRRYDYICVNCKCNNRNMIASRILFSYYDGEADREKNCSYEKIINDLIPYLLPQQRDEALVAFRKIDKLYLYKFVETFISICHGASPYEFIDFFKFQTDSSKLLNMYGLNTFYKEDGYISLLLNYARNGVEYTEAYYKKAFNSTNNYFGEEALSESEKNIIRLFGEKRTNYVRDSIASLNEVLLSPGNHKGVIIITDMDFFEDYKPSGEKFDIGYSYGNVSLSDKVTTDNYYSKTVDFAREIGDIYMGMSKVNEMVCISVTCPDILNDYQIQMLLLIKEKLSQIIKRPKIRKIKDYGFLNMEDIIKVTQQTSTNDNMAYNSTFTRGIEHAIKEIDRYLKKQKNYQRQLLAGKKQVGKI